MYLAQVRAFYETTQVELNTRAPEHREQFASEERCSNLRLKLKFLIATSESTMVTLSKFCSDVTVLSRNPASTRARMYVVRILTFAFSLASELILKMLH